MQPGDLADLRLRITNDPIIWHARIPFMHGWILAYDTRFFKQAHGA